MQTLRPCADILARGLRASASCQNAWTAVWKCFSDLIWGQPDTKDQHLLGDDGFEHQYNQVHEDGISSVTKACEAISYEASANSVQNDWGRACNHKASGPDPSSKT